METRSNEDGDIDYRDRVFHVEVMRGGMNRLLLRSNGSNLDQSRIEVLFMNVKAMNIGTHFDGLAVKDCGPILDHSESLTWRVEPHSELHLYEIESSNGTGQVVAGSMAVDKSDAGPSDPSRFFMMD